MVRRFSAFLSDAKEAGQFKRLIKELGAATSRADQSADLNEVYRKLNRRGRTKEDALDEFVASLAQRESTVATLREYGFTGSAAKAELVALYRAMIINGADYWLGNTYVAAAALFDQGLLGKLLTERANDAGDSALEPMAFRHIQQQIGQSRPRRRQSGVSA